MRVLACVLGTCLLFTAGLSHARPDDEDPNHPDPIPERPAPAATVDDLLRYHLGAVGGNAAVEGAKTMVATGKMRMAGSDSPLVVTMIDGKATKSVTKLPELGDTSITFTDAGGWQTLQPAHEAITVIDASADEVRVKRPLLYIGDALVSAKVSGAHVELAGREIVDGANTWKLEVTYRDGHVTTVDLDPITFHIARTTTRMVLAGVRTTTIVVPSDYRKTSTGLVVPFKRLSSSEDSIPVEQTFDAVTINAKVDAAMFVRPAR